MWYKMDLRSGGESFSIAISPWSTDHPGDQECSGGELSPVCSGGHRGPALTRLTAPQRQGVWPSPPSQISEDWTGPRLAPFEDGGPEWPDDLVRAKRLSRLTWYS